MQILADRIEFCWIHLSGIGTLENSLWGYDGKGIRVWLDALTIEGGAVSQTREIYESVKESVFISLDFYPLCRFRTCASRGLCTDRRGRAAVLMDKGIIIGVEHEALTRGSLPFAMFKIFSSVSEMSRRRESWANVILACFRPTSLSTMSFGTTSAGARSVRRFSLRATIKGSFTFHIHSKFCCIRWWKLRRTLRPALTRLHRAWARREFQIWAPCQL